VKPPEEGGGVTVTEATFKGRGEREKQGEKMIALG
jgi:hypothetical protein